MQNNKEAIWIYPCYRGNNFVKIYPSEKVSG